MTRESLSKSEIHTITVHLLRLQSGAEHLTQRKLLLRNIDCTGTYTSSSFIIDILAGGEESVFVEFKAQRGVFIPSRCR